MQENRGDKSHPLIAALAEWTKVLERPSGGQVRYQHRGITEQV